MSNPRKQPSGPPPDVTPIQKENVITQVREYQLITPLFGGGVAPGECDPVTVIRGTEIRGQLRFWWRATRGGRFTDIKALKEEEDKIWGAPYKKGEKGVSHEETVQITVEVPTQGKGISLYPFTEDENRRTRFHNDKAPTYAAFPLQTSLGSVQANVSFTLTISFPATKRPDIEAALWAWETFGGIGARTRRGFGALHLLKINGQTNVDLPNANKPEEWIQEKLIRFVDGGKSPTGTPHLSKRTQFKTTRASNDAIGAWNQLITRLQKFRQARYGSQYGRSMWPEADTIRYFTRASHTGRVPNPTVNKFPRAAFGLPIIFHFKDSGDPEDTSLEGATKDFERLASPLILRPLRCKNNRFIGLALLLEGPRTPPGGIQLAKDGHTYPASATLTRAEANQIPVLNGQTDVLQAFMDTLS
jgi:CRISPR-associated protein Cmr1